MGDFDEKHVDLRDKYPEVEKAIRLDGSRASVRECLKPVIENLWEIEDTIKEVFDFMGLDVVDVFVFQSRAMGTCKPKTEGRVGSDIDIYVRLHESLSSIIETWGVFYKNTGVKLICKPTKTYLKDIPNYLMETLRRLRLDLFLGVKPIPPAKDEYKGRNYYIKLEDVRGL